MIDTIIIERLREIVGVKYVTNNKEDLYIYTKDPGASLPRPVDFVVMPHTKEEIQEIIKLANDKKISITPMGGGLTLSGLVIPIKGGIVIDMKRMDKILEINESSRYVVLEAGVTIGKLLSYLRQHHPQLEPPVPDAPPSATVAGNVLIHGSGYLSQRHGDHGSMINGLEVVLPTGEICNLGSCALSDYWFSKGPLPDFIGLFTSSFGILGIVTKLSIRLFPRSKYRDVVFGLLKDPRDIPEVLLEITAVNIAEDILLGMQDKPAWMKGYFFLMTYITGDSEEDIQRQTKILKKIYHKNKCRFMKVPEKFHRSYMEKPIFAAAAADFRKGGGFEYVGAFIPLEKVPDAYLRGAEISRKYGLIPTIGSRLMSGIHTVVVFFTYSFNRASAEDMATARKALHDTNKLTIELGGIPWKAELDGQKIILENLDSGYKSLLKKIKDTIDPNGIMNPGNWEVL